MSSRISSGEKIQKIALPPDLREQDQEESVAAQCGELESVGTEEAVAVLEIGLHEPCLARNPSKVDGPFVFEASAKIKRSAHVASRIFDEKWQGDHYLKSSAARHDSFPGVGVAAFRSEDDVPSRSVEKRRHLDRNGERVDDASEGVEVGASDHQDRAVRQQRTRSVVEESQQEYGVRTSQQGKGGEHERSEPVFVERCPTESAHQGRIGDEHRGKNRLRSLHRAPGPTSQKRIQPHEAGRIHERALLAAQILVISLAFLD